MSIEELQRRDIREFLDWVYERAVADEGTNPGGCYPLLLSSFAEGLTYLACGPLRSTTAELIRVKRHKFPDTHRRPANVSVDELYFRPDNTLYAATHGRGIYHTSTPVFVHRKSPTSATAALARCVMR
ncbi:MAG: hypothetical protein WAU45_07185 [Blastocatellia bacterium]